MGSSNPARKSRESCWCHVTYSLKPWLFTSVFAFLIGAVGTLRGLQVNSSAEQLGRLTTTAVVQSIALILAADAVFTFIFIRLGI